MWKNLESFQLFSMMFIIYMKTTGKDHKLVVISKLMIFMNISPSEAMGLDVYKDSMSRTG